MNYRAILIGLTEIVDGLTRVLSLGNLHLNLAFKMTAWLEIRKLKKERRLS